MKVTQLGRRAIHFGHGGLVTNWFLQGLYSTQKSGLKAPQVSITGPRNMEGMSSRCVFKQMSVLYL